MYKWHLLFIMEVSEGKKACITEKFLHKESSSRMCMTKKNQKTNSTKNLNTREKTEISSDRASAMGEVFWCEK